jgi:uncharacterized protein (UPF0333 family)
MNKKRGQVSIELLITMGFALLIITALTILMYEHSTSSYEEINNNQAGLIARKITDAADSVYYLGHPSVTTLKLYMPDGIDNITISGREIIFNSDGSEIVSLSNINLKGNISSSSGLRYISLKAMPNYVNISEDAS